MSRKKKLTMSSQTDTEKAAVVPIKEKRGIKYVFGYIVAGILAISVAFLIMYLVGSLSTKNNGASDAQSAAKQLLTSMDTVDKSGIKDLIYIGLNSKNDEIDKFYSAAKSSKDTLNMNLDTAVYTEKEWGVSDAKDAVGLKKISDAKTVSVRLNITKTIDTVTYDTISFYDIGTYSVDGKWYIHSLDETSSIITECNGQTHGSSYIGTQELGYIAIDTNWSSAEISDTEQDKFISAVRYNNNIGEITFGKLNMSDINAVIDQYKKICEENGCEHITVMDTSLNGISAKRFIAYDPNTRIYMYIWLFTPPLSDGYVHMVSMITADAYTLYPCINSYKY